MPAEREQMRVVIGAGPDGLRAAAALASAGHAVLFLQQADSPSGRIHPEIPEGTGRMHVSSEARASVEAVLGPLVEAPDMCRAVAVRGQIHRLPLGMGGVTRLFESSALPDVIRRYLRRRLRNAVLPLTGGGQEERTYRDWITRRMGAPAYQNLYEDYAERRWGTSGDTLSCSVARVHHGMSGTTEPGQVVGGGHGAGLVHAVKVIEDAGGEIQVGANIRGLKVDKGRVVGVRVGRRLVRTDAPVWIARPPGVVAGWLGDALEAPHHVDAGSLRTVDAVQVSVPYEGEALPDEIHLLDRDAPCYRIVQGYGGAPSMVFHATVPSGTGGDEHLRQACVDYADKLGFHGLRHADAVLERLIDWEPVWAAVCHPRIRRLSLIWSELGIVAVGRQGTFSPMDVATEIALAARYASEEVADQREAIRSLLEPPVRQDDLDATPSMFLTA